VTPFCLPAQVLITFFLPTTVFLALFFLLHHATIWQPAASKTTLFIYFLDPSFSKYICP